MHTRSRASSIAFSALIVLLAACSHVDPSTAFMPPSEESFAPIPLASAGAAPSAAGGTQTETDWGRIRDHVPTGFPRFPGSTVADPVGPDPVSGTYSIVNDGTARVAGWMQDALETASFATASLSGPLEDGGFVLESVGEGACRIQTSVRPMGGLTFVIVRYGAACPAG